MNISWIISIYNIDIDINKYEWIKQPKNTTVSKIVEKVAEMFATLNEETS